MYKSYSMKKIYLLKFICLLIFFQFNIAFAINNEIKILNKTDTNTPPILETSYSCSGTVFINLYTHLITKTNDATEWFITKGSLPQGISLDSSTGEIFGSAEEGGIFVISIKAKNSFGESNEAKLTIEISKQSDMIIRVPSNTLRGRQNEMFDGLPKKSYYDNDIIYTSDNPNVVSVTDNYILNYHSYGTAVITAKTIENKTALASTATFNVEIIDPNDATKSYVGNGVFKLIKSKEELVDGYYVIASGNKAMSNSILSSHDNNLGNEIISIANEEISNPSRNIVWKVSDLALQPSNGCTIYNEDIEKMLYSNNNNGIGFSYFNFQVSDYASFLFNVDTNGQAIINTYLNREDSSLLFDSATNSFTMYETNNSTSIKGLPLQLYRLTDNPSQSTIWDGKTWSNGIPTDKTEAIVKGDLIIDNPLVAGKFILETGSVTVNSSIQTNEVVNQLAADKFIVNGAGIYPLISNVKSEGQFTVVQNSTPMILNDATLWSSPVSNQNLRNFSDATLLKRFYKYDEPKNSFISLFENDPLYPNSTIDNPLTYNFEIGKGYHIRVSANQSTTIPSVFQGKFIGQLNNGNISIPLTKSNQGYNLVGNPYPSSINADVLLNNNVNIQALYFWTHESPLTTSGYANNNYASYTKAGGVSASAGGVVSNSIISKGQGFFVETSINSILQFDNSLRKTSNNPVIMYKGESSKKIWVDLYEGTESKNQILIAYLANATNKFDDQIDAELNKIYNGSSIYTLIKDSNKSYVIQGRDLSTFDVDVIDLGFEAKSKGIFTIKLGNIENLKNQNIYLRDKNDNQVIDLSKTDYKFNSEAGIFNDRFNIVYSIKNLNTDDVNSSNQSIHVVKTANGVKIVSSTELKLVEVYDLSGKKIYSKEVKESSILINNLIKSNQLLVIKTVDKNDRVSNSKIIY